MIMIQGGGRREIDFIINIKVKIKFRLDYWVKIFTIYNRLDNIAWYKIFPSDHLDFILLNKVFMCS